MAFNLWAALAVLFLAASQQADSQQTTTKVPDAPIVQPGAPGQASRTISAAQAATPAKPPSDDDVSFMQGMIMHHSQAVEMTALLRTRTNNKDLEAIGKRISISQTDEIIYMKQWLQAHGKPADMQMDGMNMADMKSMLMPGMLTPQQMEALAKASGPQFDHLFLTGMIQHHTGALTMVHDLFETAGSGQDAILFDFATDIDNTQRAEIRIMQALIEQAVNKKETH